MSSHHHEADSRSFMLPAFLSFDLVFCCLVLMTQCAGPYVPPGAHGAAHGAEHGTEHKTDHKSEHTEPAHGTEHKTADSTEHKAVDTTHKTEAHPAEHH